METGSASSAMHIQVDIGRNFLDGGWHTFWLDLNEINQRAHEGSVPPAWRLAMATHLMAGGQMFRMDDIVFRAQDYRRMQPPDMAEMGPLFAQLFEPYRYLFMAEYGAVKGTTGDVSPVMAFLLDKDNFITDPQEIADTWLQDSNVNGIIRMDPNYLDPNHPSSGQPEPYYSALLGRDLVIDISLPIFSSPEMRIGGAKAGEMRTQTLQWNLTMNWIGANGIQTVSPSGTGSLVQPLPINPYDGMPTYMIAYNYSADAMINSKKRFPSDSSGKAHYGPLECFVLEAALWNAGFTLWPHISYMDFTPQYFEDILVTLEVTNGATSDVKVFPISVVNYPVENYAPVLQTRLCDRLFYIGQVNSCFITFLIRTAIFIPLHSCRGGRLPPHMFLHYRETR